MDKMAWTELAPEGPVRLSSTGQKASTKAFKKARRQSLWRALRHPIRIAVMAGAAMALTWGVIGALGAVATGIAAGLGVVVGEAIGRGKLKLVAVVGGASIGALVFQFISGLLTSTELVASLVGPGETLVVAVIVRFGALAFWPVLALRAVAVRRPSFVAIEVIAVAAAAALLFAAHRGGIISRPFWLSDWAWRAGLDPAHVLLAIGGITVVVLIALMVAETGRRITGVSLFGLPLAALLVMTFLDVSGLPKPKPDSELGLTEEKHHDAAAASNAAAQPSGTGSAENPRPTPSASPSGETSARPLPSGAPSSEPSEDGGEQPQPRPRPEEQDDGDTNDKSAPLAVVLLGDDYSPPAQSYYFRQEALSDYKSARLVAPVRSGVDRDVITEFPAQKTAVDQSPPDAERQRVTADVVLLVDHKKPFGLETPVLFAPRPNPNPQRFVRAYRFEALAQKVDYAGLLGRQAGDPDWPDDVRDYYLVPSTDARFAELAKQIVTTLPENKRSDPFLQALAVKRWMDQNLVYSTKERHAGVPDPTADFLFGNRIGYCVHFAHAAVFMWRSLGIPARAGSGYMVAEDNREGSSILIRSGDAHAWPELYLEGIGWVVLDISARENLDPQTPPPDKDLQRKLSELARDKPPKVDRAEDMEDRPYNLPNLWLVLAALAGATLVVLYAIKIWRRLIVSFAGPRAMTRVGYRLALDLLAEVGLTREHGEPREHFARRVHAQVPSFTELTSMHQAARWGDPRVPMDQRPEFSREKWKKALAALRQERKTVSKTSRRVLHFLNPASFVQSR